MAGEALAATDCISEDGLVVRRVASLSRGEGVLLRTYGAGETLLTC